MSFPPQPVQLDASQVQEMVRHISAFHHDINGCLTLIVAATELIRFKPDVVNRQAATLMEQPPRIAGKTREFIQHCERALGIRPAAEPSWYADLWKRHRARTDEIHETPPLSADTVRALHNELISMNKELMDAAFIISGASVISSAYPMAAEDQAFIAAGQLTKLSKRFDGLATTLEMALGVSGVKPSDLPSGTPSGPVSLSSEEVAMFHHRLAALQRDINEQLAPLLELSQLARTNPADVPARSGEFAQQPNNIVAALKEFVREFDQTFGIVRKL